MNPLQALSSLDGRYNEKTSELANYFSELALIKQRLKIEVKYILALSKIGIIRKFNSEEKKVLESLIKNFSLDQAKEIKQIEKNNNHDVKAVEVYLRNRFEKTSLGNILEFIHFGLTSEDINNIAYRLMIVDSLEKVILPTLTKLQKELSEKAVKNKKIAMLARTHGQPAVPTTLGKEFNVFLSRLSNELKLLKKHKLTGKLNGAVGNYNAQYLAYPKINWPKFSKQFVESFELVNNPVTTQINSYEDVIYLFQCFQRINGILIDLSQDMWRYISDGWFIQSRLNKEVGSSTMPQKVNPIDFENAEGNLFMANGLIRVIEEKLPISRLQRDLSNSTIIRNAGSVLGYSLIAYESVTRGLTKSNPNVFKIKEDLNSDWSILAEAVQIILRRENLKNSYEIVKSLTRGQKMDKDSWIKFIDDLPTPLKVKEELKKITPENYIGIA